MANFKIGDIIMWTRDGAFGAQVQKGEIGVIVGQDPRQPGEFHVKPVQENGRGWWYARPLKDITQATALARLLYE